MSTEKKYQKKYHQKWAKKNRKKLNEYCRNWRSQKAKKESLLPLSGKTCQSTSIRGRPLSDAGYVEQVAKQVMKKCLEGAIEQLICYDKSFGKTKRAPKRILEKIS